MKRPRIYVAGPYTADNQLGILMNINRGISICTELIEMGYAPYCPWLDCLYVITNGISGKVLFDISVEWMLMAHCLYASPGWDISEGAQKEMKLALRYFVPILYSIDECGDFIRKWKEDNCN